jgi:glycerophosphoryl diester phosphodiesterase
MFDAVLGAAALGACTLIAAFFYLRLDRGPSCTHFENLIVGHRGCRGYTDVPENSLAAFKVALESGTDAIELDVQLTADDEALVVHDDLTTRLFTTPDRYITQMTAKEARALRYKAGPTDACIPTLREVFQFVRDFNTRTGRSSRIFVELKNMDLSRVGAYATKIAADFAAEKADEYACVISFAPTLLYKLRQLAPRLVCCLLYTDDEYGSALRGGYDIVPLWARYITPLIDFCLLHLCVWVLPELMGVSMMGPKHSLASEGTIQWFSRRGMGTYVWVTNTLESAAHFVALRCSAGTDHVFPHALPPAFAAVGRGAVASADCNAAFTPEAKKTVNALALVAQFDAAAAAVTVSAAASAAAASAAASAAAIAATVTVTASLAAAITAQASAAPAVPEGDNTTAAPAAPASKAAIASSEEDESAAVAVAVAAVAAAVAAGATSMPGSAIEGVVAVESA